MSLNFNNKFIITLSVIILIFLISFIWIQIKIYSHFDDEILEQKDYIIVLGNKIQGNNPSLTLKNRLDEALVYLKKYHSKCILTGGLEDEENKAEARVMADYLISKGIDEKRLILEERSTNTKENMKLSKNLFPDDSKIGIITSDTHLFRSLYIAEKEGIKNISGHASKTPLGLYFRNMTKEYFSLIKYILGL